MQGMTQGEALRYLNEGQRKRAERKTVKVLTEANMSTMGSAATQSPAGEQQGGGLQDILLQTGGCLVNFMEAFRQHGLNLPSFNKEKTLQHFQSLVSGNSSSAEPIIYLCKMIASSAGGGAEKQPAGSSPAPATASAGVQESLELDEGIGDLFSGIGDFAKNAAKNVDDKLWDASYAVSDLVHRGTHPTEVKQRKAEEAKRKSQQEAALNKARKLISHAEETYRWGNSGALSAYEEIETNKELWRAIKNFGTESDKKRYQKLASMAYKQKDTIQKLQDQQEREWSRQRMSGPKYVYGSPDNDTSSQEKPRSQWYSEADGWENTPQWR